MDLIFVPTVSLVGLVLMLIGVSFDRYWMQFFTAIGTFVALYWYGSLAWVAQITWMGWLSAAAVYFPIGALYITVYWYFFSRNRQKKLYARTYDMVKRKGADPDSMTPVEVLNFVKDTCEREFEEAKGEVLGVSSYLAHQYSIPLKARDWKAPLTSRAIWWPISASLLVLDVLWGYISVSVLRLWSALKHIWSEIFDYIKGTLDRISNRNFEKSWK